jgi:hypothetical protein
MRLPCEVNIETSASSSSPSFVGVGGQDHSACFASFREPSLGYVHRRATTGASVRVGQGQGSLNDTDVERPTRAKRSSEARALIGAIVGEHSNPDLWRRNGLPELVALLREGAQASRQTLFFIPERYGDNEAWFDGRDEPWRRQRKSCNPCSGWVVEHRDSYMRGRRGAAAASERKNRSAAMKFLHLCLEILALGTD